MEMKKSRRNAKNKEKNLKRNERITSITVF
jgi:hypothetical protein